MNGIRPLKPEAEGPSALQGLMALANHKTSAKPQYPHLPSGAKNVCLPGWILLWNIKWINWIVFCKLKIRSEGMCIGIVTPITKILNVQMHSISWQVA